MSQDTFHTVLVSMVDTGSSVEPMLCIMQGPIDGLKFHLADPWRNNFATNGVSIPFLGYN